MIELAEQYKVHETTVSKCLHDMAVQLRRQPLDDDQRAEAVRLYRDGWSLVGIGEKIGCAHTTFRSVLIESDVPRRYSHGRDRQRDR